MPNTVSFSPTLAQFRDAAERFNAGLDESSDATLRFKTVGTGLAVSWADRFWVRVADFFSSDRTVATRKAAVLTAFLGAVQNEQGEMAGAFAEGTVHPEGIRQTRLSSRTVSAFITTINTWSENESQRESQIDTINERAIHKAAYGIQGKTPGARADMPALADIVDTAAEELLASAKDGGLLSADDLAALRQKYVGAAPREAGQTIDTNIEKFSRAIETRLREKLAIHRDDRRLLSPELISVSGSLAVKSVITPEINAIALANHEKSHPFATTFIAALDRNKIAQDDPRRSKAMIATFATIEAQRIHAAKHVQTEKDIKQARDALIAEVLAHSPALAWMADNVPDGPEKSGMIAQCLDLAPDVGATYFTQVRALALAIDACVAGLPKQSADEQQAAWLRLSGNLATSFSRSGVQSNNTADTDRFSKLATNVFVACAKPETLRALDTWMRSDAGQAVTNGIADLKQKTYVDATDSDKALIIQAGDASHFLLELQKAAAVPATPTLAEIVDAAAGELLGNNARPSDLLSESDLAKLHEKYLGTAPKLPYQAIRTNFDTVARAVEERLSEIATQDDGTLRQLTPDQILRAGKRTVSEHLRSEINGIAIANYEGSHPFKAAFIAALDKENIPTNDPRRSDAMQAAFAKIEQQRAQKAPKTQTAKDIEQARGELIDQVLSHRPTLAWVALNVPDGQYKTDIVEVCLNLSSRIDADKYFTQVSTFAHAIGTCAENLRGLNPQEQQAAWLTLGGHMQTLLQETGLNLVGGDDIANFSRIAASFFAATANQENFQAVVNWIRSDAGAAAVSEIGTWGAGADPELAEKDRMRTRQALHIMYPLDELRRIASPPADA